jgi:hypothetical protein
MKININDQFAVRLTDSGYVRLCDQLHVHASNGKIVQTGQSTVQICYPERPDGTRVFQLHELMRYFGADMSMAATADELPFATEIEWLGRS